RNYLVRPGPGRVQTSWLILKSELAAGSDSLSHVMIRANRHLSLFLVLVAVSLLAAWRPLSETMALALQNDAYTPILLILAVSICMLLAERRLIRDEKRWSFSHGCLLVLLALIVACSPAVWSKSFAPDTLLTIRMSGLVCSWIGFFVLCFGSRVTRDLLFPL